MCHLTDDGANGNVTCTENTLSECRAEISQNAAGFEPTNKIRDQHNLTTHLSGLVLH